MRVPKRRPPRPHSCSRSRSPLRQWAAAKPSHVISANSSTKIESAVQFTSDMASPSPTLGREVDDRGENRADDHPEHLVPVEERDTRPVRLGLVVEGRPKHDDELHDEEQVPP